MEEKPTKTPIGTPIQLLLPKGPQRPILNKLLPYLNSVVYFKEKLPDNISKLLGVAGFSNEDLDAMNRRIVSYAAASS